MWARAVNGTLDFLSLSSAAFRVIPNFEQAVNKTGKQTTQKSNDIKCLVDENDNLDHSCGLAQNVGISTYFDHRLLLD